MNAKTQNCEAVAEETAVREKRQAKPKAHAINLPQGSGGPFVPKVNPTYVFPSIVDDVVEDIRENKRVMLIGHTGCGKTSLIDQIANRTSNSTVRCNMNGQTTVSDFVGFWTVRAGQTEWVDGALPKAMREGWWLIIDELDCADASILAVLNAVLEPGGKLMLKEKGCEVVEPHPDFRLFATANAVGSMSGYRHLYQGTNPMNEAFLDRWRVYKVDYLAPKQEAKAVYGALGAKVEMDACERMVKVAGMSRKAFENDQLGCSFSTRRLIDWAELAARGKTPMQAAEASIFSKVGPEDAIMLRAFIEQVFGV